MYSNITDFKSDVSDSLQGNWARVQAMLMTRYSQLTSETLAQLGSDASALSKLLIEHKAATPDSADLIIRKMVHKADHFDTDAEILRNIRLCWAELTQADLGQIEGRRSNLVSLLARRYALSREHAWQQVNSFFTRNTHTS